MKFFKFAFKQSDKGVGKAFLYALLLALIFTVSYTIIFLKFTNYVNTNLQSDIENKLGCTIQNYILECEDEYQEYNGQLYIDLNAVDNDEYASNDIVLTREKLFINGDAYTYRELLITFENKDGNFTPADLVNFLSTFLSFFVVLVFIVAFVFSYLFFIIGNTLLALVMKLLVKSILKVSYSYSKMFSLSMIVVLPYVLFNALTRNIFETTLSKLLSPSLPLIGGLVTILIDYSIIFGLTYLAVKDDLNVNRTETIEIL